MKNILFTFTPAFNPNSGGVQRTTWKLGQYLAKNDYKVSYYSLAHYGHIDPEYGELFHAPSIGKNKNPENIKHLKRTISNISPDIVINQMPYEKELSSALHILKTRNGCVVIGCLRNSLFNFKNNARETTKRLLPKTIFKLFNNCIGLSLIQARHWVKHRYQLKRILKHHDYFILLAPPNRKELQYFVGDFKKENVISIPNSIPQVISNLDQKEKIILHVGRLNISQKRSELLISFWRKAHENLPDWKFVIVGNGPFKSKMEKIIKEEALPRVTMEGFQKPEPYYQKASIFIMTSAYEGFPNVLLEAQSFGCATVLFNSYLSLGWIVEDGKNALLTQPFDTAEMTKKVCSLAQEKPKLHNMQNASLKNAERFTIDKVGSKWESFFAEIIK